MTAALRRAWWQPPRTALGWALRVALAPLAWLYAALWWLRLQAFRRGWLVSHRLPVPVIVVGNLVVGGAGKSPVVIALVRWLREQGRHPGVVSRGYGGSVHGVMPVRADSHARQVGDEPLLIQRRCAVPVFVGRDRVAAARALLQQHPQVDVLVSDDGLQHLALQRDAEVIVFDARGAGNGALLPAGPLREPLRAPRPATLPLLYNAAAASTALPGVMLTRTLDLARPLAAWHAGRAEHDLPLAALADRPLLAAAGIGHPERFFEMLRDAGLRFDALPLPDHHAYTQLPWPAQTTDVLVTEKDAIKLDPARLAGTRVWVVALDLTLPQAFRTPLLAVLEAARHRMEPRR